mmetsp:Transcript_8657/g.22390  ORF Transcript_8657/g.22390 Transcript_8657/m.22390 type:complete len:303 (-) Transcript_8657:1146-2054(-)
MTSLWKPTSGTPLLSKCSTSREDHAGLPRSPGMEFPISTKSRARSSTPACNSLCICTASGMSLAGAAGATGSRRVFTVDGEPTGGEASDGSLLAVIVGTFGRGECSCAVNRNRLHKLSSASRRCCSARGVSWMRSASSGGTAIVPSSMFTTTTPSRCAKRVSQLVGVIAAEDLPDFDDFNDLFVQDLTSATSRSFWVVNAHKKGTGASKIASCKGQTGSKMCCQANGQSKALKPKTAAEPKWTEREMTTTLNSKSSAVTACKTTPTPRCLKMGRTAQPAIASQCCHAAASAQAGHARCEIAT